MPFTAWRNKPGRENILDHEADCNVLSAKIILGKGNLNNYSVLVQNNKHNKYKINLIYV